MATIKESEAIMIYPISSKKIGAIHSHWLVKPPKSLEVKFDEEIKKSKRDGYIWKRSLGEVMDFIIKVEGFRQKKK
jgi:uncharacterized membrane protein